MENRINRILKGELNKLSSKKELEQLDKLFDLTKIPQEQLNKQYYHFAIHDGFEGYGNPLMKTNEGKYIIENKEKIYNASEVKDIISQKYNFEDWQFQVIKGANNIEVCLCVPHLNQDIKILNNDMEQLGYFLSKTINIKDFNNRPWIKLKYEPKFQQDESEQILNYGNLFHLTPLYNYKNIVQNGLTPKSENSQFNYPDRIYLFKSTTSINELINLGYQLYLNNKNPKNNGKYAVLMIDSKKLKENKYKIYLDPNFEHGVYVEQSIPVSFIYKCNIIDYTNGGNFIN